MEPYQLTLRVGGAVDLGDEAFLALCRANPEHRMERTASGDLEIMSPSGSNSGRRLAELSGQLWAWNQASALGICLDSSAGFTLPNGAIRDHDASWIVSERWKALTPDQMERCAPICPDFVAEVRSPSDCKEDLRAKLREYIEHGVPLGWLIDPFDGTVEVSRPGRPVEVLDRPSTLSVEDVLPSFVLDLAGILDD